MKPAGITQKNPSLLVIPIASSNLYEVVKGSEETLIRTVESQHFNLKRISDRKSGEDKCPETYRLTVIKVGSCGIDQGSPKPKFQIPQTHIKTSRLASDRRLYLELCQTCFRSMAELAR